MRTREKARFEKVGKTEQIKVVPKGSELELQIWAECEKKERAKNEFFRVKKIFEAMGKNSDIYSSLVNRYCILQAETKEAVEQKETLLEMVNDFTILCDKWKADDKLEPALFLKLIKEFNMAIQNVCRLDNTLISKRKMLLDLEKENCMTVKSFSANKEDLKGDDNDKLLEALGIGVDD